MRLLVLLASMVLVCGCCCLPTKEDRLDTKVCDKINSGGGICYLDTAVYNQKPENCDLIKNANTKAWCKAYMADDQMACASIKDEYYQATCLATLQNQPAACNKLSINDKEDCYFEVAFMKASDKACALITDQSNHDWCYTDVAMLTKDETLCNRIQDAETKRWCTALANGNLPDCTKITSNMDKTLCQALTEQKPDTCAQLPSQDDQHDCYKYYNQYQLR